MEMSIPPPAAASSPVTSISHPIVSPSSPFTPNTIETEVPTSNDASIQGIYPSEDTSLGDGPAKTLTTFHAFSILPAELRHQIWALTFPPPRLVPLTYSPISSLSCDQDQTGCTSSAAIPTALHVGRESRACATKIGGYKLSFNLSHTRPKIWFSPSQDILTFNVIPRPRESRQGSRELEAFRNLSNALSLIDPEELETARRVAVDVALFGGTRSRCDHERGKEEDPSVVLFWEYVISKLVKVEEVIFVIHDGGENDRPEAPHPAASLSVEGPRKRELQDKVEESITRIGFALQSMKIVEKSDVDGGSWKLPKWKVVVLGKAVEIESWIPG